MAREKTPPRPIGRATPKDLTKLEVLDKEGRVKK